MGQTVVVTGFGIVSPLGEGVEENWKNLVNGHVGGACWRPCTTGSIKFNGSESPFDSQGRQQAPPTSPNGYSRARDLVSLAAAESLAAAGLWDGDSLQDVDPFRFGCSVSASKPFLASSLGSGLILMHETLAPVHASKSGLTPAVMQPEVVGEGLRAEFGLKGEFRNVIAACATGAYSIALGASWIEQGICDVVLAGSVEPYPHPLIEAGFKQMGVTSSDGVTRPFDQRRSGFTFGEGAGAVVLESARHASRRKARLLARLSGWGLGSDSHSAVAFNSNGARIADVIARALDRGGLPREMVRHVNAHGTATRLNDWIETQALRKAFGPHAERLMISATKASTGHLLGASGSVELIFTVLALCHQFVPPTATLEEPDPECPLDYTPRIGRAAAFEHALSLSFGFGGPIGALVVSAS